MTTKKEKADLGRYFCRACADKGQKDVPAEERFSLGIYAGMYCDRCWAASGYRKEGREGFDPMDAGEAYEEEDY